MAKRREGKTSGYLACKQAHLRVTRASIEEQSNPLIRSLVKRCQESEPALISVILFISALPERSEIPLIEKRQRRENCQSIMFDEERLDQEKKNRTSSKYFVLVQKILYWFKNFVLVQVKIDLQHIHHLFFTSDNIKSSTVGLGAQAE